MEELELEWMNTIFYVGVSNSEVSNWQEYIQNWFSYVEKEWSRFREDNELANVNSLPLDKELHINPILFDILQKAEAYREKTKGYFNPYMKKQMEINGYNRSFPFQPACSTESALLEKLSIENPFILSTEKCSIIRKGNGEIDLGGIAKGYAVEMAAQWLKKVAKADFGMVDGGGDMSVWSDGSKIWKIGVSHPFHNDMEVGQFSLENGSIATSNIIYRSWKQGDTQKHHILDGRTGTPVESHIIQATVVTGNCLDAEVAAKLSFMVNQSDLNEYLYKINHELKYLLITKKGEVIKGWAVNE